MKALILSAGKGERLRPLTNESPKPMIPINNKPVLEYLINLCKKNDLNEIAINTSYLPKKIEGYFGDGSNFGVKIKYSFEQDLLGTAGAINNFRDFFKEEAIFVVLYGDMITDLNLAEMIKYHKEKNSFATMFLHKQEMADDKTTPGVVLFDEDNQITKIIENPTLEESAMIKDFPEEKKLTNSGVYVLDSEILREIPEGFSDFAKDIFPKLLQKGKKLFAYVPKCYFKEVGQIQRYNSAKEEIESGKVKLDL